MGIIIILFNHGNVIAVLMVGGLSNIYE